MKSLVQTVILILIILIGVPLALGLLFGGDKGETLKAEEMKNKMDTPNTIKVWMEDAGEVREVDFEEYVACVVASEMPSDFEEEALKAQSVAARTYAMAKILKYDEKKPDSHPETPVCDTTHCQAYKTEEKLIEIHDEGWEDSGLKKVKKACQATEGEMLYYEGELVMQPLFFSSSGGKTENSEDVFSGSYPYLVSVSSLYEEGASHSDEKKTFTLTQMRSALEEKYQDRPCGSLSPDNIKILSRTSGGRVETMQAGQATFKGTEIRSAMGLSSALFSIEFEEGGSGGETQIVFTSNGSGHGVGLSQYGASGMAKEGSDYKEILSHYYTGTKVY